MFDPEDRVEKLDSGVFLERIGSETVFEEITDEFMVFGNMNPDTTWWNETIGRAIDLNYAAQNGEITWISLGEFLRESAYSVEIIRNGTLEAVIEALENDEIVICIVSDVALECNLRSPTATGAVANGHSAVRQRPA